MISSNDDIDLQGNLLAYADGETDLLGLAEIIQANILDCAEITERLVYSGLLRKS